MQSLQADQSLYNRKGVCEISMLTVFCRYYPHKGENGDGKFNTFFRICSKKWTKFVPRCKGSAKVCQIPGTVKRKKVKIADYLNEDVNHGHIKLKGVGIPLAQI